MTNFCCRRSSRRRILTAASLATLTGAALAGLTASPAIAATLASASVSGSQLTYDAGGGGVNDVTITQTGTQFTITDPGADISAGGNCSGSGTTVTCEGSSVGSVTVRLYDGNDTLTIDADASVIASVTGGDGDDTIYGAIGGGFLQGQGGDDTLVGGPGVDYLLGGDGVNTITGGANNDYAEAEVGADTFTMGSGDDEVHPGGGDDEIFGGAGVDLVNYNGGFFSMSGGVNGDLRISLDDLDNDGEPVLGNHGNVHSDIENVNTLWGNDTITGSAASNVIDSSGGDDIINGAGGRDRLMGEWDDDTLNGGGGDDRVIDGPGSDVVSGDDGDDYLDGSDIVGADEFSGGEGVDFIAMIRDADVSVTLDDVANDGQAGESDNIKSDVEDVVTGDGDDTIIGSRSANDLSGGTGNDAIRGGPGSDGVDGGLGRDTLGGGHGVDSLSGGGNVDTMRSQDGSPDYVTCGSSIDFLDRDFKDQVAVDCETLS